MKNKTINDLQKSLREEKLLKAIAKTEDTKQEILDERQKIELKILQKRRRGQSTKKEKKELIKKTRALRHTMQKLKSQSNELLALNSP